MLARLAAGPTGALPSRDNQRVVIDGVLEPIFSARARLRVVAAHAAVRSLPSSADLGALAIRHGRYLGDAAATRLTTRFLSTLSAADRETIEGEARVALRELGHLRSVHALGRRFYQVAVTVSGSQHVALAASSAKAAILAAAGQPVRVLVSSVPSATGEDWLHRLDAIALTGPG